MPWRDRESGVRRPGSGGGVVADTLTDTVVVTDLVSLTAPVSLPVRVQSTSLEKGNPDGDD